MFRFFRSVYKKVYTKDRGFSLLSPFCPFACLLIGGICMFDWKFREKIIQIILLIFALSSILFLTGIVIVLFREGLPVFKEVGLLEFVTGRDWYPTYEPADYGIYPLITASLLVTVGAMIISIPIGVTTAVFIACILPLRLKTIIKPVIEMLAGIPSVIYGLFGLKILAPFLQSLFDLPTGLTALTASIMLGIMVLPTIISIAEDVISSVPDKFREASLALGGTGWETIARV